MEKLQEKFHNFIKDKSIWFPLFTVVLLDVFLKIILLVFFKDLYIHPKINLPVNIQTALFLMSPVASFFFGAYVLHISTRITKIENISIKNAFWYSALSGLVATLLLVKFVPLAILLSVVFGVFLIKFIYKTKNTLNAFLTYLLQVFVILIIAMAILGVFFSVVPDLPNILGR